MKALLAVLELIGRLAIAIVVGALWLVLIVVIATMLAATGRD